MYVPYFPSFIFDYLPYFPLYFHYVSIFFSNYILSFFFPRFFFGLFFSLVFFPNVSKKNRGPFLTRTSIYEVRTYTFIF